MMKNAPTKNDEKNKKHEGKMINWKKKQERRRGAYPARVIRRLQKGSHMI